MTAEEILRKHEDKNEFHFHEVDREWIIEAMEEYANLRQTGIRVRFYLSDYDEEIWTKLPSRVNNGDSFYMDCFVGETEKKSLKPETYEDMIDGAILYCSSSIFDRDENGVYQQVYLGEYMPSKNEP